MLPVQSIQNAEKSLICRIFCWLTCQLSYWLTDWLIVLLSYAFKQALLDKEWGKNFFSTVKHCFNPIRTFWHTILYVLCIHHGVSFTSYFVPFLLVDSYRCWIVVVQMIDSVYVTVTFLQWMHGLIIAEGLLLLSVTSRPKLKTFDCTDANLILWHARNFGMHTLVLMLKKQVMNIMLKYVSLEQVHIK